MIDIGEQNLYLMFLVMMIDVGGHSVVYWIVALFLDMLLVITGTNVFFKIFYVSYQCFYYLFTAINEK